jgi:hypothetical protein
MITLIPAKKRQLTGLKGRKSRDFRPFQPVGTGVGVALSGVNLIVVASASMPTESFSIGGMTDPTVSVPAGAHVTTELINADADMAWTAPSPTGSLPPPCWLEDHDRG